MLMGATFAASHHPQQFLAKIHGKPDEDVQIYKKFCSNCHDKNPMLPLGAPLVGDEQTWKRIMAQGLVSVLKRTQEGVGLMPARGGCFECSDEQLEMVVKYMIKPHKTH